MSDFDLMEPVVEQELKLEDAAEKPAPELEATWPREQMLDRLRTCD